MKQQGPPLIDARDEQRTVHLLMPEGTSTHFYAPQFYSLILVARASRLQTTKENTNVPVVHILKEEGFVQATFLEFVHPPENFSSLRTS